MTARARWLVLLGISGIALGVLRSQHTLAWMSLTLLFWIFAEWTSFYWRLRVQLPQLEVLRTINRHDNLPRFLWAGRQIHVKVSVAAKSGIIGPVLLVRECVPENMLVEGGRDDAEVLSRTNVFGFEYTARVRGAGQLCLPGLRVLLQDAHGLFAAHRFLKCEQTFRVLPAFVAVSEIQSTVKRVNAIPLHGIHRLQQTGLGAELLELREYVPGDPPKSIAWKASARRINLMTRQYESEVPVRIKMFVDGSISTRIGGFGSRLIDQMIFVAASVAKSAVSVGDPVGAVLFDERGQKRISASGGERGFYRLLEALSDFANSRTPPRQKLTPLMMAAVTRLCGERCPDLLDPRINQVPFTFLPINPAKRKRRYERSLVAAILAERFQLPPQRIVELVHNDELMAQFAQRMLAESGIAWMDPLVPSRDRGFHDGMATMELLSKAITEAVAVAKDNEVYVIMANLLECATNISHLLPAVKMARARFHRVVFVTPTPTFRRPSMDALLDDPQDVNALLERAEDIRTQELWGRLKQSLHRIGARVALSGEENAIRMVMAEAELSRSGRTSRAGAGS